MNMAGNYAVSDRLVDFYAERARGGAGMITVGYATVDELSGNPGNIGAHKDMYIPGLTRLATAIRENGARSSVQLNHAGRSSWSWRMIWSGRWNLPVQQSYSTLTWIWVLSTRFHRMPSSWSAITMQAGHGV
jgi:2,4-dienoyl-CoA reductase-like NADH-dependent reductase (Old Yellow Enzyme family)